MPVKITYEDLHLPVAVRLNDRGASGILGKCTRSAMSGKAVLKQATIMTDFCIMNNVLGQSVIDTKKACGCWSPALCGAPASIVSVLTADFLTVIVSLLMCVFNILCSVAANNP